MPALSTQVCLLRKPPTMVTPDIRTGSYCWPSCILCSFRAAVFLHAIFGDNPCSCLSSGDDHGKAPHFFAPVVRGKSALRLRHCAKTRDLTRRLQLPGSSVAATLRLHHYQTTFEVSQTLHCYKLVSLALFEATYTLFYTYVDMNFGAFQSREAASPAYT